MAEQLSRNGAEIVGRTGDTSTGFHFTYRLGKTIGTATISPLAASNCGGYYTATGRAVASSRPEGIEDVEGKISIAEKWFRKDPTATQARLEIPSP